MPIKPIVQFKDGIPLPPSIKLPIPIKKQPKKEAPLVEKKFAPPITESKKEEPKVDFMTQLKNVQLKKSQSTKSLK